MPSCKREASRWGALGSLGSCRNTAWRPECRDDSRRVVGLAMANHLRAELPLEALRMTLGGRLPAAGLVHHSDRGCQYASHSYRELLAAHGTELVHRHPWPTRSTARAAISEGISVFYDRQRLHSALGYVSPADHETIHPKLAVRAA